MTPTDFLTAALVIVTGLYCYFTYKIVQQNRDMVAQMRLQYKSFIEPVVAVTIELKNLVVVCLKVENTGRSAAKNLRLTIDRDFHRFAEPEEANNFRRFPAFQQPIPSFSPGEKLFFMMSQGFNIGKVHNARVITPSEFVIDVEYEFAGSTFRHRHEVNLDTYMNARQDRSELVEEVEKLRKVVERR